VKQTKQAKAVKTAWLIAFVESTVKDVAAKQLDQNASKASPSLSAWQTFLPRPASRLSCTSSKDLSFRARQRTDRYFFFTTGSRRHGLSFCPGASKDKPQNVSLFWKQVQDGWNVQMADVNHLPLSALPSRRARAAARIVRLNNRSPESNPPNFAMVIPQWLSTASSIGVSTWKPGLIGTCANETML
jgi:hypothetical protein